MKSIVIGVHLRREDVEPVADVIAAGPLWLSVVGVDDDQPLSDRDLLVRVTRLRTQLLERATFIAVRYGFAIRSALEAEEKCAPHLRRWRTLLDRNRHHVEMTLKVAAANAPERPRRKDFASGAAYLKALHGAAQAAEVDPEFRGAAEKAMHAVEWRWIHRDNASVELAALIRRADLDAVRRGGQRLKQDFSSVPFLLSGPWPLEVFADADRE